MNAVTQSSVVPELLESRFRSFDLTFMLLHKPFGDALLALLIRLKFSFCAFRFGQKVVLKLLLVLMQNFVIENNWGK